MHNNSYKQILLSNIMKIAAAITATTRDEALRDMDSATEQGADILELRIDYLEDLTPTVLEELTYHNNLPKIVTPRHASEAQGSGGWTRGEPERLSYLEQALRLGANIDIENSIIGKKDLNHLIHIRGLYQKEVCQEERNPKINISGHSNTTPNSRKMIQEVRHKRKRVCEGDNVKTIYTANTPEDCVNILKLYDIDKNPENLIAFSMGSQWDITRILSTLYGAPHAYAAIEGKESAPDQLTIEAMKRKLDKAQTLYEKGEILRPSQMHPTEIIEYSRRLDA